LASIVARAAGANVLAFDSRPSRNAFVFVIV
jgi:hypothetical protein